MSLVQHIHDLHGPPLLPALPGWDQPRVLVPHIGEHFESGTPGKLRVMALGINAYVDREEVTHPGWFAGWFREQRHAFDRGVSRELSTLSEALASAGPFSGLAFDGTAPEFRSVYLTNAVRRYLPREIGLKAALVPDAFLDEGARVFAAELGVLEQCGVLPHVVVVFGEAGWPRAWRAFGAAPRPPWVAGYRSRGQGTALFHRLNVVRVREGGRVRPLLLVRLTHPAAPTGRWRAAELTGHPDFAAALREATEPRG